MAVRRNFCGAETGALVFVIAAVVAVVCVLVSAAIVWKMTARQMEAVKPSAARATSDRQQPFVEAWSVGVSPAVIHEFALVPGQAGEFFALNADQIYRFDASGAVRAKFAAPSKSTRIATDPRGAILARHDTGVRPLTYLAVPQKAGPDLLIVATNSGITAWRPSAARIQKP